MNLCRDCKWFDGDRRCVRWRWPDPVTGADIVAGVYADIERSVTIPVPGATTPEPCCAAGKHFEAAPPKPAPVAAKRPWWRRIF